MSERAINVVTGERGRVINVVLGILVAAAVAVPSVWFGYHRWNEDIYAAAHPSGWVTRSATVRRMLDVRYGAPPVQQVLLGYEDYSGFPHSVVIDMPLDATREGGSVRMFVRRDESIVVPGGADWNSQLPSQSADPYPGSAASTGMSGWPWGGIIFGIIFGVILGLGTGAICDDREVGQRLASTVASFHGRVGTR